MSMPNGELTAMYSTPSQPRHGFLHDVQEGGITPLQRAEVLLWMSEFCDFHECDMEVFACTVELLDKLLMTTKVHPVFTSYLSLAHCLLR